MTNGYRILPNLGNRYPVLEISNGAATPTVYNLTLTGAANDSGPIAVSYAVGVPITLSVSTASTCLSWATGANVVVQYDTSALSSEIASLNSTISADAAQIASLQSADSTLTSEDAALTSQVASLTSELSACQNGNSSPGGGSGQISYHLPPSSKPRVKAPLLMRTSTPARPVQLPQLGSPDQRTRQSTDQTTNFRAETAPGQKI